MLKAFVKDLNALYRKEASMHEVDFHYRGFEWIDFSDYERSIVSFVRRAKDPDDFLVFALTSPLCRGTTIAWESRNGVSTGRCLNSDSEALLGKQQGQRGRLPHRAVPWHKRPCSLSLRPPPLGALC